MSTCRFLSTDKLASAFSVGNLNVTALAIGWVTLEMQQKVYSLYSPKKLNWHLSGWVDQVVIASLALLTLLGRGHMTNIWKTYENPMKTIWHMTETYETGTFCKIKKMSKKLYFLANMWQTYASYDKNIWNMWHMVPNIWLPMLSIWHLIWIIWLARDSWYQTYDWPFKHGIKFWNIWLTCDSWYQTYGWPFKHGIKFWNIWLTCDSCYQTYDWSC